jgi:D-3-phosphoglycerate dehydrogenase
MPHTVFVTAPTLSTAGLDLLAQAGCRSLFLPAGGTPDDVERLLASEPVDAVISRTVALTAAAIRGCPTLKIVVKHGAGVNNIDVQACSERGIPVCATPGANARSVAEMTVGLMLCAARSLCRMDAGIKAGGWPRLQDGLELHGRTLGLVGYGQIGRKVARICSAMGMRVVVCDPQLRATDLEPGVELATDLQHLLPEAQVLSLHAPLTAHTRGLIGAGQLALLPEDAILVNTARGELVDEPALIEALQQGKLRAAGLDTTAGEPIAPDSPLLRMDNVVLTPHVGGSTQAALQAMAGGAVAQALDFLDHGRLQRASTINYDRLNLATQRELNVQ